MLLPESLQDSAVVLNIFIVAFQFVLITHVVIRLPYKWLAPKVNKKALHIGLLLGLSFTAGVTNTFVKLPQIEHKKYATDLDIVIESERGSQAIDEDAQKYAHIGSSTVLFLLWSFGYLVVVNNRNQKQMKVKLQEQQLENLMSQLNPHFLFNSMNTIRALIYEDRDKAAEVITQLSELFRYNLSSGSKSTVTLQDELEVCQRYLDIEKSRLGERIKVEFEIAPELATAKLPSMALFTLVENAVKHGLAPLPSGGILHLKATKEQSFWLLSVSNPYTKLANANGTKTGLANLSQRLELMFGNRASINTSKDNGIYKAEIKVPYEA